jgi:hypothetical protein
MKPIYKKAMFVVLDWTRKLFFACMFATLVSFWSAKWEEAQEKIRSCDCRAPAAKTLAACRARR